LTGIGLQEQAAANGRALDGPAVRRAEHFKEIGIANFSEDKATTFLIVSSMSVDRRQECFRTKH